MDATIVSSLSEFTTKVLQDVTNDVTELCSRLDRKGVPRTPTPAKKKIGTIKGALHAMFRIGLVFETKMVSDPAAVPQLLVAWKSIWAWMEFFHENCVVNAVYGEMLRIMSLRAIPITISALARDQQLRGTIACTPGAVSILTRHWLQENTYLSQIELVGVGSVFSSALRVLLSPTNMLDCMPVLDLMVDAVDAQTIARTSLEHASNAKSRSSSTMDYWLDINTHVNLIFLFVSAPVPALRIALLSRKDAVDLAAELLHILSGCPRGTLQAEKCLLPTFSVMLELFLCTSSLHWIVRAIEAGVLEDVLRLGVQLQRMPTDTHADLSIRFFTILSQMLVYRSFLRTLVKAMKKVERARIGPRDAAILWAPWIAFKSDAERCLQFKAKFEQEIQSGLRFRSCENSKVRNDISLLRYYLKQFHLVPEQVRHEGDHVMRGMPGASIIHVPALRYLRGAFCRIQIIARRRARRAIGQDIEVLAKHGNMLSKVRIVS